MERRLSPQRTAHLLGDAPTGSPAYLAIAAQLRRLIADGRIPPGTALPSERLLTAELGLSRTTVSRAYDELRRQDYLVSRQGAGTVTRMPAAPTGGTDSLFRLEAPDGSAADDVVDLTRAAPTACPGLGSAYEAATADLPRYLGGHGYFPSGLPALRASIARRYAERGLPTEPEQILVTTGAQGALAVVARALLAPGCRVLTESPTYPNAITLLRSTGARVLGSDVDASGWATTGLLDAVRQVRPRAAYIIPDYQNPTGLLMDDDERARLAGTLRRAGTLPVVDETMAELALDEGPSPLPFAAHHHDALTVGSASKAFWGGLRIGWIRAPRRQVGELLSARLGIDLGAPVLEQLVLEHLLRDRAEIARLRREQLVESRAALVGALSEHLPQWRFRMPGGGLSLWCELPTANASRLATAAEAHGVQLAPGPVFAPEGGLERFVRLPYTLPPDRLRDAVVRLAAAQEDARGPDRRRRGSRRRPEPIVT